jgi:hypothetical protein
MAAIAIEKWKIGDLAGLDLDAHPTYQPRPLGDAR